MDSAAPICCQGWLTKRGRVNKSWKQRWMVLREDGILSYYKIRDAPKSAADLPRPVGVIDVGREGRAIRQRRDVGGAAITVLDWPAATTDTTALCLATTRRVYFLVAKTSREALLWYTSLKDMIQQQLSQNASRAPPPQDHHSSRTPLDDADAAFVHAVIAEAQRDAPENGAESSGELSAAAGAGQTHRPEQAETSPLVDEPLYDEPTPNQATAVVVRAMADLTASDDDSDSDAPEEMPVYSEVRKKGSASLSAGSVGLGAPQAEIPMGEQPQRASTLSAAATRAAAVVSNASPFARQPKLLPQQVGGALASSKMPEAGEPALSAAEKKTSLKGYVNLDHMMEQAGLESMDKVARDQEQAAQYEEVDTSIIASLAASAQNCKPKTRNKYMNVEIVLNAEGREQFVPKLDED